MKISVSSASTWQKNSRRERVGSVQCWSRPRVVAVTSGQPSSRQVLTLARMRLISSASTRRSVSRSESSVSCFDFFLGAAIGTK